MRSHLINENNNFIAGWYFDDTTVCDETIKFFESNKQLQKTGVVGDKTVDVKEKDSTDLTMLQEYDISAKYINELKNVVNQYRKKYTMVDCQQSWSIVEHPNIQRYNENQGYHIWHHERTRNDKPICDRVLVFMTYLNDVKQGGETEFYYQKAKIKPEKGLTLIWPCDWMFTHRGLTSSEEVKYIITGWLSFY